MTTVWRLTISTDAAEGVDPRRFCLDRDILGVGWRVDGPESLDWDAYYALGMAQYYDQRDRGWWPAVNAVANRMAEGDLCWTRDWNGNYHVGRVTGPWRYVATPEHAAADVVNVRACHWVPTGTVDSVPGKVLNSFRAGRTLQAVHDDTVRFHSKLQFNRAGGAPPCDLAEHAGQAMDLFALAAPDDCEDIVGIYLQAEHGYRLIPSTCKRDTAKTEFVLRTPHAKAQVQVKQNKHLDRDDYPRDPDDPCEWFLFSTSGEYGGAPADHVHCLDPDAMRDFAFDNQTLMPGRLQRLLDYCRDPHAPPD
ncbi:MAG: hypothetical protein OXH15_21520 [Gammaproteobacteria bacterium]|nr:hypothetical protein [Gammaproteobacteria bacterium]